MRLSDYISDLLFRYECVIVPDFGGFITNKKPAIISPYTKTFYPPHKLINYNSYLKDNDGLLAGYISTVDKVPYESALNFIRFEVSQWKEELKKTDLTLEKLGKFSLDKNSALIFEPQTDINYLTEAYGLASFVSPEIKREILVKQEEKLEEKAPILLTERKKSSSELLKYAAIFLLATSVIGYVGSSIYKNYKQGQQVAAAKEQQKEMETKIEQATFIVSEALPSIMMNVTLDKKPYHVIAGAFRYPENAKRMVNILLEKGYDARILGINQWGLTQVSFNSYTSRKEAVNDLIKIRSLENEDAWLLVQDL